MLEAGIPGQMVPQASISRAGMVAGGTQSRRRAQDVNGIAGPPWYAVLVEGTRSRRYCWSSTVRNAVDLPPRMVFVVGIGAKTEDLTRTEFGLCWFCT